MRRYLSLVAAALACVCVHVAQAEECRRWPNEFKPYEGYTPTGERGAMERDPVWFRHVRAVRPAHGGPDDTRYALRQAEPSRSKMRYDSLTTVPLGGTASGFIATLDDCNTLLDAQGRPLVPDHFGETEIEGNTTDNAGRPLPILTLKLFREGPNGADYTYLRFQRGTLVTRSPHWYQNSYSVSQLAIKYPVRPAGLRQVTADGKAGLLRMSDLREIIPTQYDGVGSVDTDPARTRQPLLFAQSGKEIELFDLNGQRIDVPRFHRFEAHAAADAAPAYLSLIDDERKTCRLYLDGMRALLPDEMPMEGHGCPSIWRSDGALIFADASGLLHGYAVTADGATSALFQGVPGKVEARLPSGVMVLRTVAANGGQDSFRLARKSGENLTDDVYNGFTNLGCGALRVQRGTTWYSLLPDGSLNTQMFYPFSC